MTDHTFLLTTLAVLSALVAAGAAEADARRRLAIRRRLARIQTGRP